MTHCLGHGHFSNPTDTGTAHRSRARRVHRAPHPRASTTYLNPAERSAAEIRRESHRPRAARRVFARDPWIRHPAEWGAPPSPGKAGPPKRAGDVSKPNASRVRVLPIARYRRYASHGRAFTRSQVRTRRRLPGFSELPPPRVEFTQSSSRRVELDARRTRDSRHLRTIRESRSRSRVSP